MSVTAETLQTLPNSMTSSLMSKEEMTEAIIAAKLEKNMTWQAIADAIDAGVIWLTSACFGKNSMPKPLADNPAHPYGVALMTYPASRLAGFSIENAGPLFNLLLLLSFALAVVELIRRAAGRAGDGLPGWGMAALGVLPDEVEIDGVGTLQV